MTVFKKIFISTIVLLLFVTIFLKQVSAHEELIDTSVDFCSQDDNEDRIWYILNYSSNYNGQYLTRHIGTDTTTIKYYIYESTKDHPNYYYKDQAGNKVNYPEYSWSTDVGEDIAEDIKDSVIASILKWNNVYFYSYSSDGIVTKHKIINIEQGTLEDHNLSIYPVQYPYKTYVGGANSITGAEVISDENNITHKHTDEWYININVDYFYKHSIVDENNVVLYNVDDEAVESHKEKTGAHELGHLLGLGDVDLYCTNLNFNSDGKIIYHHNEVLMGYAATSTKEITYKDIAGVSITRGFHTSNDHIWLWDDDYYENNCYKLICSICNGVKYVTELPEKKYIYKSCRNSHDLTTGNMMAVASYGEFDYYKCKFCRYVAPVNMKMRQEYSYEYYDDNDHILNSVNGLEYSMIETHNYNKLPVWLNKTQHSIACICGNRVIRGHAVSSSNTSRCIICGGNVSAGIISPFAANNTIYVTDNGSYMLPNGVIVLDEKDIKLYMDGKLNFYNENLSTS